jgi:hypothetical protein
VVGGVSSLDCDYIHDNSIQSFILGLFTFPVILDKQKSDATLHARQQWKNRQVINAKVKHNNL